jgi:hypothetical protein
MPLKSIRNLQEKVETNGSVIHLLYAIMCVAAQCQFLLKADDVCHTILQHKENTNGALTSFENN